MTERPGALNVGHGARKASNVFGCEHGAAETEQY